MQCPDRLERKGGQLSWRCRWQEGGTHQKAYAGDPQLIGPSRAYSMYPFTSEESVTSSHVKNECPDAIINIVYATNLSRSLFFTTLLLGKSQDRALYPR